MLKTNAAVLGLALAAAHLTAPNLAAADVPAQLQSEDCPDQERSVCQTLPYAYTNSAQEYYWFFDNDEDVAAYVSAQLKTPAYRAASGADAEVREVTHDPAIAGVVAEVFEGFKEVFPEATAGLTTPPPVVILNSKLLNAYAVSPTVIGTGAEMRIAVPWLFIINSALLEHEASDNGLRGVLAHELGHLILRNGDADVFASVQRTYVVQGSEDGVLGEAQPNDPLVAEQAAKILVLQARVGSLPELGQPVRGTSYYERVLDLIRPDATNCDGVDAIFTELKPIHKALLPLEAEGDLTPIAPTPEQQAELDRLDAELYSALEACEFHHTEKDSSGNDVPLVSLAQVVAVIERMPLEAADPQNELYPELRAKMFEAERDVDDSMPDANLAIRMQNAQRSLQQDLLALRADPAFPIDEIRVYDREEDADDAAMRVLMATGYDPHGIGDFLLSVLDADTQQACLDDIAEGRPISAGELRDTHPPICWRVYHVDQFSQALDVCAATNEEPKPPRRHHRWFWPHHGKRSESRDYNWDRFSKPLWR